MESLPWGFYFEKLKVTTWVILTHVSGTSRLRTFTSTSKLFLENTTLSLDGTYTFSHGSIDVISNVRIEGSSSHTFRLEASSLFIAAGSSLTIGEGVTFEFAPTASTQKAVYFEGASSELILDGATLTVSSGYGMHLVNGNLVIKGDSTVDNAFTDTNKALRLGAGPTSAGDCKLKVESGARLNVKRAGVVFQNLGAGSLDLSNGEGVLDVKNGGNFLFKQTADMNSSGMAMDILVHFLESSEKAMLQELVLLLYLM